ncbi:DUF2207 domain-containing protein [Rhodohalobacter sp. 8-1]|uniref:DUF2207 domain-containing protein n=1 Tax=Rhodohalobacter sp. 8-1 TaxID=3131972 RepID=UPI0030EBEAAB
MTSAIRTGIFLLIIFALPSLLFANEYTIPTIDVDVRVTDDGRVQITEHRTYVFNGDFSWADYSLPKDGFTEIESISVSENGTAYINQNTDETGTFSVSESDNAFIIKWNYDASDTTRTFTLSYTLNGAVAIGPDWSEFFWNYLSASREKSTDTFNLAFRLPGTLSQDSLYTFTRSEADNFDFTYISNGYDISGESISRRQSARIRTLFPTSLFDAESVSITHPNLQLESVLADEEAYREA